CGKADTAGGWETSRSGALTPAAAQSALTSSGQYLRSEYSARRSAGPRTAGSGCSYLPGAWPTPRASASENRMGHSARSHGVTHGRTLAGEAGSWPTPRSRDWKGKTQRGASAPMDALPNMAETW